MPVIPKIVIKGKTLSVNDMYRGRRFLTEHGKAIKEFNTFEAGRQYKGDPLEGKLRVSVLFVFSDNRRHDIDNCLKGLFDSLTGLLWKDDNQIVSLRVEKTVEPLPRCEISVETI